MSVFIKALATLGAGALMIMVAFMFVALIEGIKYVVTRVKRNIAIKRRFDKPPTAKCYCVDCKHWGNRSGSGYCSQLNGWCTADNWFCWKAEPKEKINE